MSGTPTAEARGGARAYRAFLGRPGVVPLLVAGTAVGMSGTMAPVSLVLFARHATGSFALASIVLGADTAGSVLAAPARGRLLDRRGVRHAVLGLAVLGAITDIAFIVAGVSRVPVGLLTAISAVSGAATAPVGAAMRNAWSDLNPEADLRAIAYATLTVSSQVTFIGGPLLAGLVLAVASSTAAVILAAALDVLGAVAFLAVGSRLGLIGSGRQAAATASPEPETGAPSAQPVRARRTALAFPGLRVAAGAAAGFGLSFGALDVALPAFGQRHGHPALGGILLAVLAVGIAVGGFLYGLRHQARSAGQEYPYLSALAAVGLIPALAASSTAALAVAMLVSGICFAPIAARQFAVVDEIVPRARRSEAMSWLGTAYGAMAAAGAALSGQLVHLSGTRLAIVAAFAGACAAAGIAGLGRKSLTRPPDAM